MFGRGHDPESDSCRFPLMRCSCKKSGYQRLQDVQEAWSEGMIEEDDSDCPDSPSTSCRDLAVELRFYNDNQSYQTVVVEKNLCASDLCQLLALKNRVTKSKHWCIIECWNDLGLERLIEDHEYVLAAYKDMKNFSLHSNTQYRFRKDFRKYEFFHFPDHILSDRFECPLLFSQVWTRDERKRTWTKGFMVIRGHRLYVTPKLSVINKFMRASSTEQALELISTPPIPNHVRLFGEYICEYANLNEYNAYSTLNAKNQFRAPTEWGIVLRPTTATATTASSTRGTESTEAASRASQGAEHEDQHHHHHQQQQQRQDEAPNASSSASSTSSSSDLRCLACESDKVRSCWITAMRLAKYGKQLRENYRAFRNKQGDNVSKDYSSYSVPNESVRSRVAMDFTGPVGRIVEDPQEAIAIAAAEGYAWKRRWRGGVRPATAVSPSLGLDSGVHCTQPWFHQGMTRDKAAELISKHGTVDGVFLVRDSRSNPGSFVITYKFNGKVIHAQVNPLMDPLKERCVLSIDNGTTKFYDLLQLVEFYQLNAGCLPTRLTHYVSFALTEDDETSAQLKAAE